MTLPRLLRLLAAPLLAVSIAAAAEPDRPNIVLIISDDHGFDDYGFMGNEAYRTPNLDRMAAESLLYTRGYSSPVCSPSLATLLTGLHPHQHGITGNDLKDMPGNRAPLSARLLGNPLILPKSLTEAGYLTLQTGKLWNMSYREVGFTDGMTGPGERHGGAGLDIGRKGMQPIFDFMAKSVAAEKPFFVWYAPFLPHTPHNPPAELLQKYKGTGPTPAAETYKAMVEWLDNTCGELDRHLTDSGLSDNTLVLYIADNGWEAAKGRLSTRSKLTPFELGIRTPVFARWPGKITPLRDDETLASILDIVPTILNAAGIEPATELPGLDLLDREAMAGRDSLFVDAFTHDIVDLDEPGKSVIAHVVIDGWHKLILPGVAKPDKPHSTAPEAPELFDLKADPLETKNLAAEQPETVRRLTALLAELRKTE